MKYTREYITIDETDSGFKVASRHAKHESAERKTATNDHFVGRMVCCCDAYIGQRVFCIAPGQWSCADHRKVLEQEQ